MLTPIFKFIGILIVLYLVVSLIPYLFERKFIFQGKPLTHQHKFPFNSDFKEHFILLSDSTEINALVFKSPLESKGLIFYCHGNADNLNRWGKYTNEFLDRGYDVFAFDYRGYGKSAGKPEKDLLLKDAEELWEWTIDNIEATDRIIYGRSLGAAVASHVASTKNASQLFLETPFDDFQNLLGHRFPYLLQIRSVKNNFSNLQPLGKSRDFPIHIFHGTKDKIVPLKAAENLRPLLKSSDSFTIIEGGGHKNLAEFPSFQKALDDYLGNRQ